MIKSMMLKMGLGDKMLAWFHAVYSKPEAIIKINDLNSETICLTGDSGKDVLYLLYYLLFLLKP